ncbi:MAG: hypothetical protein KBD63_03905 [Bacteriovoracaceae bacterium]|nr:hypothetical protein [Bacteriovoracaceae bacterium]
MNERLHLFELTTAIRSFFGNQGFYDVLTPPLVENPGMETHIHPFQVNSIVNPKKASLYLHTSPEFYMKELLSQGLEKIFTMSYCFRDEPASPLHRSQFIMLEWYRTNSFYTQIMQDCIELTQFCHAYLKNKKIPLRYTDLSQINFEKRTVQEIFKEILNIDILNFLEVNDLKELIQKNFKQVPLPLSDKNMLWEDYYFLLFLNLIEPHFVKYPFLLLYEFPAPLCALSTLKKEDPRVCERFEIYMQGIELCNAYNELTDANEQKKRFNQQAIDKKMLYGYDLPEPKVLYQALEKGLPACSGIAMGVERLLLSLSLKSNAFFD